MSTLKLYILGFVLSIALTLAAYFPVLVHVKSHHLTYSHVSLIIFILALAITQLVVQLVLFLHIGKGQSARWNTFLFLTTVSVVLIVIVGSLWIMSHLNYNMTPQDIQNYVNKEDAF